MKKIAVIVGHNPIKQGALSIAPLGRSEFDFNAELAQIMLAKSSTYSFEIAIFYREYQKSYRKEIQKVYEEVDAWKADFSTELHFNSAVFTALGSEVLSSGSIKSLAFAKKTQKELINLFERTGKTDRGVKVRKKGARGYRSLVAGKAAAIIVEPFFGSNRQDVRLMHTLGLEKLAEAYLRAMEQL